MNDRWERLIDLYHTAVMLPADERATLLSEECGAVGEEGQVALVELKEVGDGDGEAIDLLGSFWGFRTKNPFCIDLF